MRTFTVVLLVTLASACGGGNNTAATTTTAPSPAPTAATFSLTGQVTDGAAGSVILGATVRITDGPNVGRTALTDVSGIYVFTGLQSSGFTVAVSATNYVSQSTGVTLTSNQTLSFRLNRPTKPTVVLTGRVTDSATVAPIPGATVSFNGRYTSTTDGAGEYSVAGFLDAGSNSDFTYVSATNYENDYHFVRGTIQNVRLRRIARITAGESMLMTIAPDDTLCVNNSQDEPGLGQDYVCRIVRVVAPSAGDMMLEALSTQGAHPPLEIEIVGGDTCCSLQNPRTVRVTAGTEVIASVEMAFGSTVSQSFTLNTSMSAK